MPLSAFVFAALISSQQPAGQITDWREAVQCLAVFESTAIALYNQHQSAPDAGHDRAATRWDDMAFSLVQSMNDELSLEQGVEAERIRAARTRELSGQDVAALLPQAETCSRRLPDPPRLPS